MRVGASLVLVAIGIVLRFGVAAYRGYGLNVGTIGVGLMVLGAVGLVLQGLVMASGHRTVSVSTAPAELRP